MGELGNIVSATKMFLSLLGNIFAFREANFVSATVFPGVGKWGSIDRKHNVSTTMFPQALIYLGGMWALSFCAMHRKLSKKTTNDKYCILFQMIESFNHNEIVSFAIVQGHFKRYVFHAFNNFVRFFGPCFRSRRTAGRARSAYVRIHHRQRINIEGF